RDGSGCRSASRKNERSDILQAARLRAGQEHYVPHIGQRSNKGLSMPKRMFAVNRGIVVAAIAVTLSVISAEPVGAGCSKSVTLYNAWWCPLLQTGQGNPGPQSHQLQNPRCDDAKSPSAH